jgi:hypothetical protein
MARYDSATAMKENLTIRIDPAIRRKLEARQRAGGFSSLGQTIAALVDDPGVRLFALFRDKKRFEEIVVETGIAPEIVLAFHAQYRAGFNAPPPLPVPVVVEKMKLRRAELGAQAKRDANETRLEIAREKIEASDKARTARIEADRDRDEQAARMARLAALSAPSRFARS